MRSKLFAFAASVTLGALAAFCALGACTVDHMDLPSAGLPPLRADGGTQARADAGAELASADAGASPGEPREAASGPDGRLDMSAFATPGESRTVTALERELFCFGEGAVGPCGRVRERDVVFPAEGAYRKITLKVSLACPANGCDKWIRRGFVYLVRPGASAATPATPVALVELGRFATTFQASVEAGAADALSYDIDVTDLRPLLRGDAKIRTFVDTWSPQGDVAANGGGWLVTAKLDFEAGAPEGSPVFALPLEAWEGDEPPRVPYGDPATPIAASWPSRTVLPPRGPSRFAIRSIITGHGYGNSEGCAESCKRTHDWVVGGTHHAQPVWRESCPLSTEGTASLCAGGAASPWVADVSDAVRGGETATIAYEVESYVNTCNDRAPNGGLCTGCGDGGVCAFNGGSHTEPFYFVSSVLVGYR